MNALILSIGDELVSGLTVNTNASWLAQQLTSLGISTLAHLTVPDDLSAIAQAITDAVTHAKPPLDFLLITGGLGPTEDDLTRQALAQAMNSPLIEDPTALADLQAFFQARHRPMAPSNAVQALRPAAATCIPNPSGTAPGLRATLGSTTIYVTPGVPREMTDMFTRSILPELQSHAGNTITRTTKINTFGQGESALGEKILDLMRRGGYEPGLTIGTTVHEGIVSVRIYATGSPQHTLQKTDRIRQLLHARFGPLIFGENDTSIAVSTVKQFQAALNTDKIPNDITIYSGVGHAFASPSAAAMKMYNPDKANEANTKMFDWLKTNLPPHK